MPRPRTDLRPRRKKVCIFCRDETLQIDYKETGQLRKFVSDRGKIRPRRVSGNCRQHQRDIAVAIRNAREMALLPVTVLPTASREQRRERPSATPTTTTGPRAAPVAAQGSVKAFDPDKGFGFIAPDGGGPDVYVHHSAIDGDAARTLEENQRVSFEIIPGKRGPKADHVRPCDSLAATYSGRA